VAASALSAADALPPPPDMMAFVVAPPAPPPPPPPPAPPAAEPPRRAKARPRPAAKPVVSRPPAPAPAPVEAPADIRPETGREASGPPIDAGFEHGVAGGISGGVPGGVVVASTPPPPPAPAPPRPVRVGGEITAPRLVRRVNPEYPDLAMRAQIEAVVILEATVDRRGRVDAVTVLRGHDLLNEAAAAAVRQWQYEPLRLNGTPTPFVLTVTVSFSLG
jgi:protein TonB